jgi:hypothetical protein
MNEMSLKEYIITGFSEMQTLHKKTEDTLEKQIDALGNMQDKKIVALEISLSKQISALKDYSDSRFSEMQRSVDLRSAVLQTAVDKSDQSMNKRFETVNEFRGQLKDQAGQFITRDEYNAAKYQIQTAVDKSDQSMNKRVETVNDFRGQLKDQAGQFIIRDEYNATRDQIQQHLTNMSDERAHFVTRNEFSAIQRLVYLGMGGVIAIEILLRFLVK